MASDAKNIQTTEDKQTVKLTEDDIPGAKIEREMIDQCSVTQLKRWLLCRGAKTSGKKAALVDRVRDYQNNGLDSKYLRDPDGGIHLLKKKAQLGVLDETEPDVQSSFPKEGFKCDLSELPNINFGTIWRYMIDNVAFKKQLSTAKPLVKGYNFYKSGHVLFLSHLHEKGKHYIKSKVLPSMKKKSVYSCNILLSSFGNILRGYCGCPAGNGRCNHVAATMFALEEFCKERVKNSSESCTSKPCKWNVPRKRTGEVSSLVNMKFSKHDYNKKSKLRRFTSMTPDKDVRASHQRQLWPQSKVENMTKLIKEYEQKSGHKVSWLHILSTTDSNDNVDTNDNTITNTTANDNLLPPIKEQPISNAQLRERCKQVKMKLQLSKEECKEVESITTSQSQNPQWYNHRKYRITASQCHRAAALRENTSPSKAIRDILFMNLNYQSKSMEEGLKMEEEIMTEYIELMDAKGHKGLSIERCGFFISPLHGFLGASPDGVVHDPSVSESDGLVEVKYIQMKESESLEDALLRKRICKTNNGLVVLNTKHQYYYQVQQQMYVTERSWCDFVVRGTHGVGLYQERVQFCQEFWKVTLQKLESFFTRWIAPEIAYPRVKHGLDKLDARIL